VNSQIALELFLKYFYSKNGLIDQIRKKKKNQYINDFNDFSQILNHFYSQENRTIIERKELAKLLDVRNSIVHKGQDKTSEKDIAESVVRTLFFIHSTAWFHFNENLFFNNYTSHKIGESRLWRRGAESFAEDFIDGRYANIYKCHACGAHACISAENLALDDSNHEDDLICLNCFSTVDLSIQAKLLDCHRCYETAYYVDSLNEQDNQLYIGKCVECETEDRVRKCKECGRYYHPSEEDEVKINNVYFCSENCADFYY
jgi:hypothetical protein